MQIQWDPNKCCHAGVCVKNLPAVFKIEDGQFVIDSSQAREEELLAVIGQCPSAALSTTK
ncbi:hypothetical protein JCM14076_16160 [Methylosoma difficile]